MLSYVTYTTVRLRDQNNGKSSRTMEMYMILLLSVGALSSTGMAQRIHPLPTSRAVSNGEEVSLDCAISDVEIGAKVEWTHKRIGGDAETISYKDELLRERDGAYLIEVSRDDLEENTYHWILTIRRMRSTRDTGLWTCKLLVEPTELEESTELLVLVAPSFEFVTGDLAPAVGSDVTLECVATGGPEPIVAWSRSYPQPYLRLDGGSRKGFLTGRKNNTLVLSRISRDQRGEYTCAISNGIARIGSQTVLSRTTYIHLPYIPEVRASLPTVSVTVGSKAVLACVSQAYPATSSDSYVVWRKDGEVISGDHSVEVMRHPDNFYDERYFSRLIFPSAESRRAGTYECEFTNSQGSASATVKLTLEPNIDPNFGARP